uniref:G-protein coupled receptors family 1 profile domain-containing protein n=1 Tax=Anopheles farauti TaxID=69004 RepID=A0A182QSC6_9DIPT
MAPKCDPMPTGAGGRFVPQTRPQHETEVVRKLSPRMLEYRHQPTRRLLSIPSSPIAMELTHVGTLWGSVCNVTWKPTGQRYEETGLPGLLMRNYITMKTHESHTLRPILMISSYEYVEYIDGNMVAACLSPVDSFWPASFFVGSIVLFFIVPLLILVVLYSVIAKNLMDNPTIIMSSASNGSRGNVYKYRKQVIFMLGAVVIVRSDSISSGARKGGGTFHTGSTNLSSSHGTNSSQRKSLREDSINSSNSIRRPTVQFQQPPVSEQWHPGQGASVRRHSSSIISIRAVPCSAGTTGNTVDGGKQDRPAPVSLVHENGHKIAEEVEEEEEEEKQEAIGEGGVAGKRSNTTSKPQPQQPLPNSNGFHRIKDRVRFKGSRHSYRARLDFHHYRGGYVGHGHLTATNPTTKEDGLRTDDHQPPPDNAADNGRQHRSNDNNQFSLLKAATAALTTATTAAASATAVVVIVATGTVPLDPAEHQGNRTVHIAPEAHETEWMKAEGNGKESSAACMAPSVGSMECDI